MYEGMINIIYRYQTKVMILDTEIVKPFGWWTITRIFLFVSLHRNLQYDNLHKNIKKWKWQWDQWNSYPQKDNWSLYWSYKQYYAYDVFEKRIFGRNICYSLFLKTKYRRKVRAIIECYSLLEREKRVNTLVVFLW